MLDFNLKRIFRLRGIEYAPNYLVKNGFSRSTANILMNFYVSSIKLKHVERLCRLFHCTPNDLLDWTPEEGEPPLAEDHPLTALRRERVEELTDLLKEMPLEKMSEVEDFLRGLKEKA